jgi:hypothetical protein
MMNGIHSDISTRANVAGPMRHDVAESVSGNTLKDPWYLRVGRRENEK